MTVKRLHGAWFVVLWAIAVLAAHCGRAAEPLRVRVLSYNIHHGEGVDGKLDLPRIAKVIFADDAERGDE